MKFGRVLLLLACSCMPSLQAQTLKITSPAENAVFHPGQTVTVTVEATGKLQQVVIIAEDPLGTSQMLSEPPFRFSIQIPKRIPAARAYQLTAVGMIQPGKLVDSEPIEIDLEPAVRTTGITVQFQTIDFEQVGDQLPLLVDGKLDDGSEIDLTKSTKTTYVSSNPAVATVDRIGLVTAISPGRCRILIDGMLSLPVTVRSPQAGARKQ